MNKILSDWFYVIKNCSVDNTYKMGWGKSIVECCLEDESIDTIHFDDISKKMFKYPNKKSNDSNLYEYIE